ncbi:sensor histidine kinase [Erythrobacter crassostreae]|uniref:histidine kinase n=1 Tax=Erythrobacter crassostreae TaxID=2828328 RepID=A0A9X1F3J1_9SPHN|nr:HAMP domain-containing sensor histidine kinase [Erythrobacter crassostrea]MBV7259635.1 HAMP domain-containing histidine kinase [Erythrobacter crassostrea]
MAPASPQGEGEGAVDGAAEGHAPASPPRRGSLARRMGLIAAGWISLLLLVGGLALDRTLANQVKNNFDEQLEYVLTAMIASAEIDPFGDVYFYRSLGDQRFLEPNSGFYWQISGGETDPWPSRSLWDRTIAVKGDHFDNEAHFYDSDQFADEPIRVAERTIILPGSETRWTFAVASATEEMDAQIQQVRAILIWSFLVLGLGLIAMALLQIRYGLQPLRRVRAAISRLRTSGDNRITEPLPTEVQPLVEELNGLLEHSEKQAEEARTHAGNLAHALKTPLTVLTNAATARSPDLNEAVFRETRTMQRHVDHHLARARAVGRRAVGHARTDVRASAEAVRRAVERLYPSGRLDIAGKKDSMVAIERQDLDEILGNLIENAAKYGGGSVFVTVDAEPDEEECVVWVEDDGMGIPEEERNRIFDRGARLDTGKPGTGLGLAIVRDVAEIYGGGVTLTESEDLGGLQVELRLPRA